VADAPQTGVVTGTVVGPDGDPMTGATVQLISGQGTMTAVTEDDGEFRFVFLVPGEYTARADLQGFQSAAGEIVVKAGGRADVTLKLGEEMGEEIVVTGETPMVDKYDMTSGGTIEPKELQAVTGQGQQYRSRLLWLPGVFNDEASDEYRGDRPVISGVSGSKQMYFVDGVDVSFARWGGGSQLNLPATSVSSMKLEATGADAQFSRAVGAYTQTIVKSGTNQFRGSAWYQAQNLAWNGDNKNIPSERPDDINHGFDIFLGGPIVRDKLWFALGYRDVDTPGWSLMADGESVVDKFSSGGSRLAKLDWRPNTNHSIAAMWVETPNEFPWWGRTTYGDLETVAAFDYGGDIVTLRWNYAITDDLLLTAHGGTTEAQQNRTPWVESNIEDGCTGSQPCGNAWLYRPFDGDRLYRNSIGLPFGAGDTAFPRDQANASLEWFAGAHDILFGVDYQQTGWEGDGVTPPLCRGRGGFAEDGPGGFPANVPSTPARLHSWCRFYPTVDTWQDGWRTKTESDNLAIFVRDKIALDRWTFNIGVRMDDQAHKNDVGQEVMSSRDFAPRVAATFDVTGDSTLLLSGTAGRYYAQVELAWAAAFNQLPTQRLHYQQFRYNLNTGMYDIPIREVTPGGLEAEPIDPYYKDEATLGLEWQFDPNWAFKTNLVWWEGNGFPQIYDQFNDDETALVRTVENTPGAKQERTAVSLMVQRRYRNNWMMAASYTYADTDGNCDYLDNGQCRADFNELSSWTNNDGVPWSHHNRFGPLPTGRRQMFKLRGAYNWQLGRGHSINVGGLAYATEGRDWNLWTTRAHPELGTTAVILEFTEPRGARRLDWRQQLDLNLEWRFPLGGNFNGYIRGEILNVLNDQEQIGIAGVVESGTPDDSEVVPGVPQQPGEPGEPVLVQNNFQYPRAVRLQIGFNF
jgi:hypothetical protein